MLTVCNFSEEQQEFRIPEEFRQGECLIANLPNDYEKGLIPLKPYEAFVLCYHAPHTLNI